MKYEGKVYGKVAGRYIELTQTVEDLENDIIRFAEWLNENNWFTFQDGKWRYTFEHGTAISNKSYEKNYTKTTEELYNIYKKKS